MPLLFQVMISISDEAVSSVPVAKPVAPVAAPNHAPMPPAAVSSGPPQTSTSWAAAAGKGLPTTTHNEAAHNNTSTTSISGGLNANGKDFFISFMII